jgi:hypothetical protein
MRAYRRSKLALIMATLDPSLRRRLRKLTLEMTKAFRP